MRSSAGESLSILRAVVLGLVQGATEFLPISSSAHLVLVPYLFGWPRAGVGFDVALHIGTLAAVVWVFRADLWLVIRSAIVPGPDRQWGRRLFMLLVVGSVPAAIFGFFFAGPLERAFERPVVVSIEVGITGIILLASQRRQESARETRNERSLTPTDAASIGVAQAVSILPGISRSGATIAAGIFRGLDPQSATRFSFLLSIPAIAGAALFKAPDIAHGAGAGLGATLAGMIVSGVSGFVAIHFFLRIVARGGLRLFAYYTFAVMATGLLVSLLRG